MQDGFDPYYKWLGIPPQEQPPNHYRLLALPLFESDPEVIECAADQRMGHVRTYQSGRHSASSQQVLNELATARICLLSPEKKAAYDADLQAQLTPAPPQMAPPAAPAGPASVLPGPPPPIAGNGMPAPSYQDAAMPMTESAGLTAPAETGPPPQPSPGLMPPEPDDADFAVHATRTHRRKAKNFPLVVSALGVTLLLFALAIFWLLYSGAQRSTVSSNDPPSGAPGQPAEPEEPSHTEPLVTPAAPDPPDASDPDDPSATIDPDADSDPNGDPNVDPATDDPSPDEPPAEDPTIDTPGPGESMEPDDPTDDPSDTPSPGETTPPDEPDSDPTTEDPPERTGTLADVLNQDPPTEPDDDRERKWSIPKPMLCDRTIEKMQLFLANANVDALLSAAQEPDRPQVEVFVLLSFAGEKAERTNDAENALLALDLMEDHFRPSSRLGDYDDRRIKTLNKIAFNLASRGNNSTARREMRDLGQTALTAAQDALDAENEALARKMAGVASQAAQLSQDTRLQSEVATFVENID